MKTIQPIPIWDNGQTLDGKIFNTYAINVTLNNSATFYYAIFSENEDGNTGRVIAQGNLYMDTVAYEKWTDSDEYAWEWAAGQLGLTITGDYVPPAPPVTEPPVTEPTP